MPTVPPPITSADLLGIGVGFRVAEPTAHIGFERQKPMARPELCPGPALNPCLDEMRHSRRAYRGKREAVVEKDLKVGKWQSVSPDAALTVSSVRTGARL